MIKSQSLYFESLNPKLVKIKFQEIFSYVIMTIFVFCILYVFQILKSI